MNKMVRGVVVALCAGAMLVATGCGPSVCDRSDSVNQNLETKKGDCDITLTPGSRAVCDANIGKCTADDQDKINAQLDCMENVSTCEKGNELAWAGELAACAKKAEGISADCANAFKSE